MNTNDKRCPHCRGINAEDCPVCDGRGHWPEDALFQFLASMTVPKDETPDGQQEFLIGEQGVVVGLINDDSLTVYNYKVCIVGEGDEPYIMTGDMLKPREVITHPFCPACDDPLMPALGQMNRHLNKPVWTCDNDHCDVSSVAFEFPLDFDFAVMDKRIEADNPHFPSHQIKHVWRYALEFECDLIQEDTEIPVDAKRARKKPKYQEALRILREHQLLPADDEDDADGND